jgi:hypothetical protein
MKDEYIVLRFFNNKEYISIAPLTIDLKNEIFADISDERRDEIISSLYEKKFIQDKVYRTFITEAGRNYLDKTYFLEQAYGIIDAGLEKLDTKNDSMGLFHVRRVLKIEQEVEYILDHYNLVKFLNNSSKFSSVCEIQKNGRKAIEVGGIEKYIKLLEHQIKSEENRKNEMEDLQYQQLDYSVQELQRKLRDYDKVEKRAKDANTNSIISICLSILIPLIILLLKWKCNVPSGQ